MKTSVRNNEPGRRRNRQGESRAAEGIGIISGFTLDIVLTYVCELGTTTSSTATLIHTTFTIVINDTGAKTVWSLKC